VLLLACISVLFLNIPYAYGSRSTCFSKSIEDEGSVKKEIVPLPLNVALVKYMSCQLLTLAYFALGGLT